MPEPSLARRVATVWETSRSSSDNTTSTLPLSTTMKANQLPQTMSKKCSMRENWPSRLLRSKIKILKTKKKNQNLLLDIHRNLMKKIRTKTLKMKYPLMVKNNQIRKRKSITSLILRSPAHPMVD
jgi:hypothetical protein